MKTKHLFIAIFSTLLCTFCISYFLKKSCYFQNQPFPHVSMTETSYDFGKIPIGIKPKHVFTITNKSRKIIRIKKVQTPCSCTGIILSEKVILPSKATDIELTLDTTRLMGQVHESCAVVFENPKIALIKFDVRAFVFTPTACFSSNKVLFNELVVGEGASAIIKIINTDYKADQCKILALETSSPFVSAEYREDKAEIYCLLSKTTPVGPINEKISVKIQNNDDIRPVEIPVVGEVIGPLKVVPKNLFLGILDKNQLYTKEIIIYNMKKDRSFDISVPQNAVKVKLKSQKEFMRIFDVQLQVTEKTGFFKGEILLQTSLKEQPLIKIPFAGYTK